MSDEQKDIDHLVEDAKLSVHEILQRSKQTSDTYVKMKTVLVALLCWAFVWLGLIAMLHATVCVLFPDTVAAVNVGVSIVVVLFPVLFALITSVLGDDCE